MAASSQGPCRLMRIPKELRDQIYDYLFEPQPYIPKNSTTPRHTLPDNWHLHYIRFDRQRFYCHTEILRICRQIYTESLPRLAASLQLEIWDGYWVTPYNEPLFEGVNGWPGWHLTLNGHRLESRLPLSEENARLKLDPKFRPNTGLPPVLMQARHLKLHIICAVADPDANTGRKVGQIPMLARANHVLLIFSLALAESNKLESLEIEVEDRTTMGFTTIQLWMPANRTEALKQALYPVISSLPSATTLRVTHKYVNGGKLQSSLWATGEALYRDIGPIHEIDTYEDPRGRLLRDGKNEVFPWLWDKYCRLREKAERLERWDALRAMDQIWVVDSFGTPGFYDWERANRTGYCLREWKERFIREEVV